MQQAYDDTTQEKPNEMVDHHRASIKSSSSWKAPGIDEISNFWLKKKTRSNSWNPRECIQGSDQRQSPHLTVENLRRQTNTYHLPEHYL